MHNEFNFTPLRGKCCHHKLFPVSGSHISTSVSFSSPTQPTSAQNTSSSKLKLKILLYIITTNHLQSLTFRTFQSISPYHLEQLKMLYCVSLADFCYNVDAHSHNVILYCICNNIICIAMYMHVHLGSICVNGVVLIHASYSVHTFW